MKTIIYFLPAITRSIFGLLTFPNPGVHDSSREEMITDSVKPTPNGGDALSAMATEPGQAISQVPPEFL